MRIRKRIKLTVLLSNSKQNIIKNLAKKYNNINDLAHNK
jgi:hypothetical protein